MMECTEAETRLALNAALARAPEEARIVQPEPAARLGAIPIEDLTTAQRLAGFNRRGRMAFWSVRRHGASEAEAMAAAERTLPR